MQDIRHIVILTGCILRHICLLPCLGWGGGYFGVHRKTMCTTRKAAPTDQAGDLANCSLIQQPAHSGSVGRLLRTGTYAGVRWKT